MFLLKYFHTKVEEITKDKERKEEIGERASENRRENNKTKTGNVFEFCFSKKIEP